MIRQPLRSGFGGRLRFSIDAKSCGFASEFRANLGEFLGGAALQRCDSNNKIGRLKPLRSRPESFQSFDSFYYNLRVHPRAIVSEHTVSLSKRLL